MVQEFIQTLIPESIRALSFFGNSISRYALAIAIFFIIVLVYKTVQVAARSHLQKLVQKTHADIDEVVLEVVKSLRIYVVAYAGVYFGALALEVNELVHNILFVGLVVLAIHQIIATSYIAVAFALQQVLSDLFGSFAIYFDKPFVPGDFVLVGDKMGTVEKIGIKTTRVKSLQGEELVFSNQQLTSATIQNYQRMEERRIVFEIGVVYETSVKKLRQAVTIVKQAIEDQEGVRIDRAHFKSISDASLTIEAVYYCESPNYNEYMDANQNIMFTIKEQFEKNGIVLAYPTRTVHMSTPSGPGAKLA